MSDPIDRMLDAAESGKSIIKNREILHFTYIPNIIFHRDSEQEQVAQSLLPILKQSRPSIFLFMENLELVKLWLLKKYFLKYKKELRNQIFH